MSKPASLMVVLGLSAFAGFASPSSAASLTAISDDRKPTRHGATIDPDRDGNSSPPI